MPSKLRQRPINSFAIVFFAAPVMRTVERIELPSTRQRMMLARWAVDSLFIAIIIWHYACTVKHKSQSAVDSIREPAESRESLFDCGIRVLYKTNRERPLTGALPG
jgi:hypothetical protein